LPLSCSYFNSHNPAKSIPISTPFISQLDSALLASILQAIHQILYRTWTSLDPGISSRLAMS
jgi:hypothetical protein